MPATAHKIARTQDGIWLSATCAPCGESSHLTTRKGQVTRWVNRHLEKDPPAAAVAGFGDLDFEHGATGPRYGSDENDG